MKIEILSEPRVICSNRDSFHNYFAWPSVSRLPDGNLAMVASGYRLRHVCPFGKGIASYSFNEGKTWTRPAALIDTPLDDRDCGIAVYGDKVILTIFNNKPELQRFYNDDERQKFYHSQKLSYVDAYLDMVESRVQNIDDYYGSLYAISTDGGYNFGKLKKVPVSAPHGPAVSNDGLPIYIGTKFEYSGKDEEPAIQCYAMNDNDEFEYRGAIENIYVDGKRIHSFEPHSVVMPDGRIIVHIRAQGTEPTGFMYTVYQSESSDGGRTFTKPHPLLDKFSGSPPHLLLHSSGTLISTYSRRQQPYGIRAMLSKDGGDTWDTEHILCTDSPDEDLGYPCSVELKDGSILTVYYDHIKTGDPAEIMQVIWKFED